MKATLRCILLMASLLLGIPWAQAQSATPVPAMTGGVTDTSSTLSVAETEALNRKLQAFEAATGAQMRVLMVRNLGDESIEDFARRVYDQWRPGRPGVDDGIVMVLSRHERKTRFQVGVGLESAISGEVSRKALDAAKPFFKQEQYAQGFAAAADVASAHLTASKPFAENRSELLVLAALGGLLAFSALVLVRMRIRRKEQQAQARAAAQRELEWEAEREAERERRARERQARQAPPAPRPQVQPAPSSSARAAVAAPVAARVAPRPVDDTVRRSDDSMNTVGYAGLATAAVLLASSERSSAPAPSYSPPPSEPEPSYSSRSDDSYRSSYSGGSSWSSDSSSSSSSYSSSDSSSSSSSSSSGDF